MMKKVLTAIIAAQLITLTVAPTVRAASNNGTHFTQEEAISINYVKTSRISSYASVNGTTVTVSAHITAKNGKTASSGTLYIEKKTKNGWKIKDSWEFSGKGSYSISKEYSAKKGKYREHVVADVGSDHIDSYSNEVTVN